MIESSMNQVNNNTSNSNNPSMNISHSAKVLKRMPLIRPEQSDLMASKLMIFEDLLAETCDRKMSLTEMNNDFLDHYLDVFQEKVDMTKKKRRMQKLLIEQLAKINDLNRNLERKNSNLDRDFVNESRLHIERRFEIDEVKSQLFAA